jgi:hypothetical protein
MAAPDEQTVSELVEERARLVQGIGRLGPASTGAGKPLSRDQRPLERGEPIDVRAFVQSVT